ncbi:MAG: hypothetical protein ACR2FN_11685 [Chitinophagaceae bacterium]
MKRTLILLICLSAIKAYSFAQSSDTLKTKVSKDVGIDLYAVQTPLLSKKFYGVNWNIKYFPTERIGTGVYITFSQKKIGDTFTYSIGKPIIYYYEIGWINQYNFLQTDRMRVNINLINGLSVSRLGDNAIKEKRYKYRPKEVATNYFYLLEPGAGFSFKLISNNQDADLWLTAETNYRFVFGSSKYATTKQFSGYLFGIGISIIGFTDEKERQTK